MKKITLILLCFTLAGCTHISKSSVLREETIELKDSLAQKEAEIARLEGLSAEKDRQLSEKDSKIEELKNKLAGFGVF